MKTIVAAALLLLTAAAIAPRRVVATQSPKQPARLNEVIPSRPSDNTKVDATGLPCLFDFERGELPDCVRESATGELSIAPELLKKMPFDSHGLAVVRSSREGWMYINRRGRVVVKGVPAMDNWADSFHYGLVRFVKNQKYGFANRRGEVVIAPIYDGAMNFEKGEAKVCKGCVTKPTERDAEYHFFAGGEWYRINTRGIVLARIRPEN